MMTTRNEPSTTADREFRMSRVYDAPREVVWQAWTDPEQAALWWGPDGFTTTTLEMDVRTGGRWRYIMHGPDGVDYPNLQEFIEVLRPERLVYRHSDDTESPASEFRTTVTFGARENGTEVTMVLLFASAEERTRVVGESGAVEGGSQHLARLAEHLARK
jgi:uncharacterized protein YndB with AHSA1/START domain